MKILGWLDHRVEGSFLPVFLLTLIILTSANVVLRYVFNGGLTWSDEICKYHLIFSGLISISCWIRHKNGIYMDALTQVVPGPVKMIFQALAQLIMLMFFLLMFKGAINCWPAIKKSGQVSGAPQIPMAYVYMTSIIGFGLALPRGVQSLVLGFVQRKKGGNGQRRSFCFF